MVPVARVRALAWILVRQLRARWRSWALLAVLIGLAGGVVLTAGAGARRTDSAYARFLQTSHAANILVSPNNTGFGGYYSALARLPGAQTVAPIIGVQALPVQPGPKLVEAQVYAATDRRYGNVIERPRIIAGRLPDPTRVHEVALDLMAAQQLHVRVGGTVTLAATLSTATDQRPQGLRVFHQKVVGVVMTRDNPVPINALAQLPVVFASRAFYAGLGTAYRSFDGAYVRLRPGASAFQFVRQAEALAKRYSGDRWRGLRRQPERPGRPDRPGHPSRGDLAGPLRARRRPHRAGWSSPKRCWASAPGVENGPDHPPSARAYPPADVVRQPDAGGGRGRRRRAPIAVVLSVLSFSNDAARCGTCRRAQPPASKSTSPCSCSASLASSCCCSLPSRAILANRPGNLEHRGARGHGVRERPAGLALADRHPGDGVPRHP